MLAIARPGSAPADLAAMPVGQRDTALLHLHRQLFGETVSAETFCPQCNERLEMDFPVSSILVEVPDAAPAPLWLEQGGYRLAYRLPSAGDLALLGKMTATGHPAGSSQRLAEYCVQDPGATGTGTSHFPPPVWTALEAAITQAVEKYDPQAEILLELDCPHCHASWQSHFDIVVFLWRKLERLALDLVADIHALASAYGWSEREILALSPQRRRTYLGMVRP